MQFYWTEYSIIYLNLFIVVCALVWLFWNTAYDAEVRLWSRACVFFVGLHAFSQIFMFGAMAPSLLHYIANGLTATSNIGFQIGGLCLIAYFPTLPQTSFKTYVWLKRVSTFLLISHALFVVINTVFVVTTNNPSDIITHLYLWPVTNRLTVIIFLMYIAFGLWHIRVVQKSENSTLFSKKTLKDIRVLAVVTLFPACAMIFYTTYIGDIALPIQALFYISTLIAAISGAFIGYARTPSLKDLMFLPKLILTSLFGFLLISTAGAFSVGFLLRSLYQGGILLSNPSLPFVDMTYAQYSEPFRIYMHQHIWPLPIIIILGNVGLVIGGRLFLTRTFLRPLNALLAAVTEVKSGNLAVSLQPTSEDEFGILSATFNEMVGALDAAQAEIQQANATLENRVLERTQELALAKDSAEKANKAKTLFLAKMGHEFRTPLNAIMGFSQLFEQNNANQAHAQTIHKNGQHLLNLVENILDAAQGEAQQIKLQPAAFDLPATLAHLVQTMSLKAVQKELALNYVPKDLPAIIVADAHRLQQVLINLLTNAIKFTDSGSVTLAVETVTWSKAKATICFAVQDSGKGIAPEDLALIFAPFKQITQQDGSYQKGSGLGLAISQQLVTLMDSKLHVMSTLHKGSTFSFYAEFDFLERQLQPQSRPQLPTPQQIITPKSASPLLVLPPADVLKKISAAAQIGDVMEIEKQLFPLVAEHGQYQPFVQRIEEFLTTYQMQNLRNWLASLAFQTPLGDSAESQIRA